MRTSAALQEKEWKLYQSRQLNMLCISQQFTSISAPEDMKPTVLRSRKAAGRVNFLAKRKHWDGFPLLVHHSLRYSVS